MDAYNAGFLTGSSNGAGIAITATTSGAAQLIHTAPSGTTAFDEITLWFSNSTGSAITVTIEWTSSSTVMMFSIPAYSTQQVIPGSGLPLRNGGTVKVFASSGSGIVVYGRTVRVIPG